MSINKLVGRPKEYLLLPNMLPTASQVFGIAIFVQGRWFAPLYSTTAINFVTFSHPRSTTCALFNTRSMWKPSDITMTRPPKWPHIMPRYCQTSLIKGTSIVKM